MKNFINSLIRIIVENSQMKHPVKLIMEVTETETRFQMVDLDNELKRSVTIVGECTNEEVIDSEKVKFFNVCDGCFE